MENIVFPHPSTKKIEKTRSKLASSTILDLVGSETDQYYSTSKSFFREGGA